MGSEMCIRDSAISEEANQTLADFVRAKIREIVHDPATAEKLLPDYFVITKRPILEDGYFEAYNRDNVHFVDSSETPIQNITKTGVQTSDEHYEFDVIVYATGFDAFTGAFDRMDVRGVNGLSLKEKWSQGPVTYLGLFVHGFPNLMMISGPQTHF